MRGWVDPNGHSTTYRFEYGTSAAYGSQTASVSTTSSGSWRAVSAALTGLAAETTYHYRLVANNSKGSANTSDRTFTTTAAAAVGTPPTEPPAQPPSAGEPQPGTTVGATLGKGTVLVRARGSAEFVELTGSSSLPFGSEVDATQGSLSLTSVLPSGAPQTGAFGGGRFVVRHSKRGFVDLHLRGRVCPAAPAMRGSKASLASAAATRPARRLWGRDSGGRFRTHGKNSHATVRGTRWLVVDRCDGTFTRVTEGSVVVRDLVRDMRRVVTAGESYLARPPR